MSDDYERKIRAEIADAERGTWREALRSQHAPWFDGLDWGFQVGDGWQGIIEELTSKIAEIVGGPEAAPGIRIVQVKEKMGTLRYYVRCVPRDHGEPVGIAVMRAEGLSAITCEVCGTRGKLVNSGGYYHVACPEHENRRSFRGS